MHDTDFIYVSKYHLECRSKNLELNISNEKSRSDEWLSMNSAQQRTSRAKYWPLTLTGYLAVGARDCQNRYLYIFVRF